VRCTFLVLLLATTACTVGGTGEPTPSPLVCEVRFAAPSGYRPLEPFEVKYDDHVGVRLGFRAERRREVHVFAGIPGEIGEGLPSAGRVRLTEGRRVLWAVGRGEVWVVVWDEGDICDPRAVLVNGLSRREFVTTLAEMGLAAR
jgi:hypothetical protein